MEYLLGFVFLLATVQASCPGGWHQFQDSCYHFSNDTEQWLNAKNVCGYIGGHLLEIETQQENEYLTEKLLIFLRPFWIGLNDLEQEGHWVWSKSGTTPAFTSWVVGAPNNNKGNENCAMINPGGYWNDLPCTTTLYGYICEKHVTNPNTVVGR